MSIASTTSTPDGRTGIPPEVFVRQCHCLTALGDAAQSAAALAGGRSALTLTPVLGEGADAPPEINERVPLALVNPMDDAIVPRWWPLLTGLAAPLRDGGWGTRRRPVFVTGSNYGVDNLYALQRDRNRERIPWSTPHGILTKLRETLGWGENVTIFSHACVSAQLGLLQAQRALQLGLADEALVFSFDFLSPFVTGGFHALKILNAQMPQPYRRRATGSIGLGDGAAWAILSREPSPYRIAAQSTFNEMHHFTANDPSGNGFQQTLVPLHAAAEGRRLWVKGHGTGTLDAGLLEAEACAKVFGESAPLVSWKGALGHTLGSCALVELAIALSAREQSKIPATVLCGEPEGEPFNINVAATQPFDSNDFDATVLLSNAFGGAHAGMLLCYD